MQIGQTRALGSEGIARRDHPEIEAQLVVEV